MSYTVTITFNADAAEDYASTTKEWTGVWSTSYVGNSFVINLKADAYSPDNMYVFPLYTISMVHYVPEGDALG